MVDARTHDQAGCAAKVTCGVTQVMSERHRRLLIVGAGRP